MKYFIDDSGSMSVCRDLLAKINIPSDAELFAFTDKVRKINSLSELTFVGPTDMDAIVDTVPDLEKIVVITDGEFMVSQWSEHWKLIVLDVHPRT